MPQTDRRGLPLSTTSATAAAHYREGVDLLLSAWTGADAKLDAAIAADPDFALAYAARARLHAILAQMPQAREQIAKAETIVARHGSERERSHVDVMVRALRGDSAGALTAALQHVDTWPRDVLIFSMPLGAFGLFAFSGMADHDQARVDLCERHAASFSEDDWWFLTNRGWSHAENGAVARGRALTQRAVELRRANANAVHALSHAMFEGGDGPAAERLIADWLPDYDRSGVLHGHIAWHQALTALERDDAATALSLYHQYIRPAASKAVPINLVTDCASFLWRLSAYGHSVPAHMWGDVAAYATPKFPQGGLAFVDVHMAMIAAATGDRAALDTRVTTTLQRMADGRLPAGPVVPAVCRAFQAFADGDDASCLALLEPVLPDVVRIGGSGAQREIVEDMQLVALMRSGESEKARAVLDRRLHRRPSPRDTHWRARLDG